MTASPSVAAAPSVAEPDSRRRVLLSRVAIFALALGLWVVPIPRGADRAGLAPLRDLRRGHLSPSSWPPFRCLTAAMLAAGAAVLTGHDRARQGLRRLRQRQRAPRGRGVSRRQQRREVRTRAPHQLPGGERVRAIDARAGLQHLPHRRGHRAGLPEQHRPERRALSDRPLARPGRGLEAGRREHAAGRRLSHVLRHGEPRRLLGALDDGHVGEPDRRRDRAPVRPEDQLRLVASRRVRSGARGHPRCCPWCCTGCFPRACAELPTRRRPPVPPCARWGR